MHSPIAIKSAIVSSYASLQAFDCGVGIGERVRRIGRVKQGRIPTLG